MEGCSIEDEYVLLHVDKIREWVYKVDLLGRRLVVGDSDLPWLVKFGFVTLQPKACVCQWYSS